jgi:predicted branched-subunit amino acid permease
MIPLILLQVTTPLLNGTISNSTNPGSLLQSLNNSPAYNGNLGFAISLMVLGLVFAILSFRIKVTSALMVASYIALLVTLVLTTPPLAIESSNAILVMVALALLASVLIVFDHILHPFD